jgi:hypothetical protein
MALFFNGVINNSILTRDFFIYRQIKWQIKLYFIANTTHALKLQVLIKAETNCEVKRVTTNYTTAIITSAVKWTRTVCVFWYTFRQSCYFAASRSATSLRWKLTKTSRRTKTGMFIQTEEDQMLPSNTKHLCSRSNVFQVRSCFRRKWSSLWGSNPGLTDRLIVGRNVTWL